MGGGVGAPERSDCLSSFPGGFRTEAVSHLQSGALRTGLPWGQCVHLCGLPSHTFPVPGAAWPSPGSYCLTALRGPRMQAMSGASGSHMILSSL